MDMAIENNTVGVFDAMRLAGNVSAQTISNWIAKGWLTPVAEEVPNAVGRPGRRFDIDDVLRVAEERRTLLRDKQGRLVTRKDRLSIDDLRRELEGMS